MAWAHADLSFSWYGYLSVFANNAFTALYLAMVKHQKISHTLDASTLLFYNSVLSILPLLVVTLINGDLVKVQQYPHLGSASFQGTLALVVSMGVVINHSTCVLLFRFTEWCLDVEWRALSTRDMCTAVQIC